MIRLMGLSFPWLALQDSKPQKHYWRPHQAGREANIGTWLKFRPVEVNGEAQRGKGFHFKYSSQGVLSCGSNDGVIDKGLAGSADRIFSRSKFYTCHLRVIGVICKRYKADVGHNGLYGWIEFGKKSNKETGQGASRYLLTIVWKSAT